MKEKINFQTVFEGGAGIFFSSGILEEHKKEPTIKKNACLLYLSRYNILL